MMKKNICLMLLMITLSSLFGEKNNFNKYELVFANTPYTNKVWIGDKVINIKKELKKKYSYNESYIQICVDSITNKLWACFYDSKSITWNFQELTKDSFERNLISIKVKNKGELLGISNDEALVCNKDVLCKLIDDKKDLRNYFIINLVDGTFNNNILPFYTDIPNYYRGKLFTELKTVQIKEGKEILFIGPSLPRISVNGEYLVGISGKKNICIYDSTKSTKVLETNIKRNNIDDTAYYRPEDLYLLCDDVLYYSEDNDSWISKIVYLVNGAVGKKWKAFNLTTNEKNNVSSPNQWVSLIGVLYTEE